ncbi:MAG: hypothetical protein J0L97_10995 [Alphaproteobacteria bacterium]|nr:hypothetical protein [Alphaproteobacteria bacterium]
MNASQPRAYGPLNTHDITKCFAIAMMVLDHLGAYLLPEVQALRILGRTAFPLFFFLIGYAFTSRIPMRLWGYAGLLTALSVATNGPVLPLDILVSVAACRLLLPWMESRGWLRPERLHVLWLGLLVLHPLFIFAWDYGSVALMFAVAGRTLRHYGEQRIAGEFLALSFLMHGMFSLAAFGSDVPRALCLVILYAGLGLWMRGYSLRPVAGLGRGAPVLRWVSQWALDIYAWHVLAFMLAGFFLYPKLHAAFRWI